MPGRAPWGSTGDGGQGQRRGRCGQEPSLWFLQKERTRQWEQAEDRLVWVTPMGSGAQGCPWSLAPVMRAQDGGPECGSPMGEGGACIRRVTLVCDLLDLAALGGGAGPQGDRASEY